MYCFYDFQNLLIGVTLFNHMGTFNVFLRRPVCVQVRSRASNLQWTGYSRQKDKKRQKGQNWSSLMVSILHLLLFLHLLFENVLRCCRSILMFGIKNETHVKKKHQRKVSEKTLNSELIKLHLVQLCIFRQKRKWRQEKSFLWGYGISWILCHYRH